MSSSSSNLLLLSQGQSGKELTANALFNALSPASLLGSKVLSGLTWSAYGGAMVIDGVLTVIADQEVNLTASATNYIEATRAGVLSKNTTGFTAGSIPLYTAVVGTTSVSSWIDYRAWAQPQHITSKASVAVTTADVTLTQAQAACRYLTITGALTGNRNVIVPAEWEGIVYCSNSGAYTTTIKTSAGAGIVVAQTKRALLLADGTDVVRVTADV
jgi:hypothetical protein